MNQATTLILRGERLNEILNITRDESNDVSVTVVSGKSIAGTRFCSSGMPYHWRTRQALLKLCEAIRADIEEHPHIGEIRE